MSNIGIHSSTKITAAAPIVSRVAARRKKRVLMVGMHLTKTRGGISTLTKEILNSSLIDDFKFDYVASQAEDLGKFAKAVLAFKSVLGFVGKCFWRSPEMVYVHVGSNASLYRESFFVLLAKVFGHKTIAHFHAGDFDFYYARQNALGKFFIRRAIGLGDRLIAVSEDSARRLRALVGAKKNVICIPNGIRTSEFDFSTSRENDETVRLLFVGAVGKLKGERDLIEALKILKKRGEFDLKISMLGYGAENLRSVFEENGLGDWIEFLGAVALEKRVEFYRNADVFVLPTYGEAMSMSIIEAMAAGLPVVSTDVGGNPELVENGVNGWLVNAGDRKNLAEKIAFFVENAAARKAFGEKAKQKAQAKFDIRNCVENLREFMFAGSKNDE